MIAHLWGDGNFARKVRQAEAPRPRWEIPPAHEIRLWLDTGGGRKFCSILCGYNAPIRF
jgi:hypothetical protein